MRLKERCLSILNRSRISCKWKKRILALTQGKINMFLSWMILVSPRSLLNKMIWVTMFMRGGKRWDKLFQNRNLLYLSLKKKDPQGLRRKVRKSKVWCNRTIFWELSFHKCNKRHPWSIFAKFLQEFFRKLKKLMLCMNQMNLIRRTHRQK